MEREKRVLPYHVTYTTLKSRKAATKSPILRLLVTEKLVLRSTKECHDIAPVHLTTPESFLQPIWHYKLNHKNRIM